MLKDYDLSKVPEVHFCNDNSDLAYVVNSTLNSDNTSITAKVPNKLLEESLPLYCYIYLTDSTDETSMKTIVYVELPVKKRKKPDDYHYEDDSDVISLRDRVSKLETYAHTIVAGFIPIFSEDGVNGLNWSIYRWADGTTTFDKIKQNPDLAGTEILIGTSVYKYSNAIVGDDGVVPFGCGHLEFQRMIEGTEDGVINDRGHHLPCGYAAIKGKGSETFNSLTLYDENENVIQADSDGDLEQCAILYDESYSVKGFKIDKNTKKAYLSDYAVKSGTTQNATGGVVLSNNGCVASGKDSVSGGDNCTASGVCSVSLGALNNVSGKASFAMGALNTIEGEQSYALGNANHLYDSAHESFSIGIGNNIYANNSLASGTQNTLGDSDTASSNSSAYICSFGSENKNYGGYIYSFGDRNTIGEITSSHNSNHIFAVGSNLKVLGDYSFAFGSNSAGKTTVSSSAPDSFVFGSNNQACCQHSIIFGDNCTAGIQPTDDNPHPIEPIYSVAIGVGQIVEGYNSLAFGVGSHIYSSAYYSYALGGAGGHAVYSPYSLALGCGCTVGIEPTTDNPSPKQNSHCYAIGSGSKTSGNLSFSFGGGCSTTGNYSLTFGTGSSNSGNWSVAIGSGTNVEADYSFAFGNEGVHIYSGASNSIALMSGAKVHSSESVAIGCGSVAGNSENDTSQSLTPACFTFGSKCMSRGGYGSLATGYNTISSSKSQFVTGKYNKEDANNKYGFILGNGNYDAKTKTATRSNAIAVDWQGKIYVNNSDTGVDVLDLLNRVKALEAALDGLKLKKTTTTEYDSLESKDNNTVYFCTE